MDRKSYATRAIPTVLHRSHAGVYWHRLLACIPLIKSRLLRWRGLRPTTAQSASKDYASHRNDNCDRGVEFRLHRAVRAFLTNGGSGMMKPLISATFALGLVASTTAFAAKRTVTLAVQNMYCAACPHTVRSSLQSVPGVKAVSVSYEEKTAVVTFDDAKTNVKDLTAATTNAGYPSAPKG